MDSVLVEVYLPANGMVYDIRIPLKETIAEVTKMVTKALSELSLGQFAGNETTALCDRATGTIFNINLSVYEQGICNGSKLMLI